MTYKFTLYVWSLCPRHFTEVKCTIERIRIFSWKKTVVVCHIYLKHAYLIIFFNSSDIFI